VSAPTKELRLNLPEAVFAGIEAQARAFGKDKAEIGREIVMAWHRQFHSAATLYARSLARNGLQAEFHGFDPEDDGIAWNLPEPNGRPRHK
jgi:hypothetical protein